MFKKDGILFFNQWGGDTVEQMIDYYLENEDIRTIFFNGMWEYEVGYYMVMSDSKIPQFHRAIKKRKTKVVCILGSDDGIYDFYNNTNTVFEDNTIIYHYSTFFLRYSYFNMKRLVDYHAEVGVFNYENMDRLFISLTNKAHYHRAQLMDTIFKYGLNEHGYLSWMEPDAGNYEFKYWKPEKLILDVEYEKFLDCYMTVPEEMYKSFISVVSESTMEVPFITEKTYMAIMLERPFLVWGCPEINKKLETMGFLLFDEIFDYSFDLEINDGIRLEGLVENLKRLKGENYTELRNKIYHKLIYNKNHLKNIAENREMIPDILVEYAKIANKDENFIDLTVEYEELDKIPKYSDYEVTIRDKRFFLR